MKTTLATLLCITAFCLFSCNEQSNNKVSTIPGKPLLSEVDTFYFDEGGLITIEQTTKETFDRLSTVVYDTSEANNINRDADLVARSGDSLFMKVGGVKRPVLINNNDSIEDKGSRYSYLGKIEGQYVVFGLFYEWFTYDLINQNTGDTTSLIGKPVASPGGKHIICVNADMEAQFTRNGIQLYKNEQGKQLQLLGSRDLTSWGPEEARWLDNRSFIVKGQFYDTAEQNFERVQYLKLTIK